MKRAYEQLLDEFLSFFPCVVVIGPRQCGKTTLLQTLPQEQWTLFDLERTSDFNVIATDPGLFLRLNPNQVAIDEAQLLPELFAAIRVAIDADRTRKGRFVLTGSSSPELLKSIAESLAGRVGIIEMAPFAWAEVAPRVGQSFSDLLMERKNAAEMVDQLTGVGPRADIQAVHEYWFQGGFPEPWLNSNERFRSLWADQFIRTYVHRDIGRLFPGLNRQKFQLFISMLAGLSGSVINYAEVARALGVSQPTAREYFEIAHGTFLWRRLPPFEKNAVKRVVKHPKGYLRDSGMVHRLLKIPDIASLLAHPNMGRSFEGMVIEEVIRQLQHRGAAFEPYYYRTAGGAEVDLLIEGNFGLIPFEIKHASHVKPKELRALKEFVAERNCPLGVVINNDLHPRLYADNILGLPFAYL